MNLVLKLVSGCALMAVLVVLPASSFAQEPAGRWVSETYRAYPDHETSLRVAEIINSNTVTGWRRATVGLQHPVTRDFAVIAERFYPDANQPNPQAFLVNGQLTKNDPMDRLRLNMHAKTHQVNLVAGRAYTIDLMSGDGRSGPHNPGFFDTWLRIEDAQGNIKDTNDDGGEGLNSRSLYTPTVTGTYTIVVTSYASNVTGSYTLRIR